MFIPPQNFGMVDVELYRSAHPTELNFPFLEKLCLRLVIYLSPDEPSQPFTNWLEDRSISLVHLGESMGKRSPWQPMSEEIVLEGLRLLLDAQNYPVLVMCALGRQHTGTLVGCLRKLQGWTLTSILEEYRRHAGSKFRLLNEQFIELFDVDLVHVPQRPPAWLRQVPSHPASQPGTVLPS